MFLNANEFQYSVKKYIRECSLKEQNENRDNMVQTRYSKT